MDNQEAELRQRLRAAGVSVQRQGNNIMLVMASDITFPVDGDQVNPQFYQTLAAVGEVLAEYNKTTIEVSGHTDSTGAPVQPRPLATPRQLGRLRPGAERRDAPAHVRHRLRRNASGRQNATPAGRAKNRRVEIQIIPLTS